MPSDFRPFLDYVDRCCNISSHRALLLSSFIPHQVQTETGEGREGGWPRFNRRGYMLKMIQMIVQLTID